MKIFLIILYIIFFKEFKNFSEFFNNFIALKKFLRSFYTNLSEIVEKVHIFFRIMFFIYVHSPIYILGFLTYTIISEDNLKTFKMFFYLFPYKFKI